MVVRSAVFVDENQFRSECSFSFAKRRLFREQVIDQHPVPIERIGRPWRAAAKGNRADLARVDEQFRMEPSLHRVDIDLDDRNEVFVIRVEIPVVALRVGRVSQPCT